MGSRHGEVLLTTRSLIQTMTWVRDVSAEFGVGPSVQEAHEKFSQEFLALPRTKDWVCDGCCDYYFLRGSRLGGSRRERG